ncbi:single-stranded DNA-binding protein 3-like [Agrilus planipennis]|uniref:Single-stranded DNA-binding protein 3-like n=1 Tax=Agrilus planipennis TaxID=224129 RepID=A0A7F5RHL5_AGRPL|nr:single-stranded DNA-binding protein 3-like [Agrilus planipennis]
MYAKGKGSSVPSDAQAREKLALYVYEYLLHIGAQKAAQTFLSEIRWEKNITLGEPPGFLHSWWCVFWDLYCAAPERRDTCEHSSEAKAFHDYVSSHAFTISLWINTIKKDRGNVALIRVLPGAMAQLSIAGYKFMQCCQKYFRFSQKSNPNTLKYFETTIVYFL